MKIGFSLGRCIRDIVNDVVDIDDVLLVVCATKFDSAEQLTGIIDEYLHRRWYLLGLDEAACQGVASVLWKEGKIHQPRNFGAHVIQVEEFAVWADLMPTGGFEDPMVKDAWQVYRGMIGLTGNKPDKEQVENNWKR